MTENSPPPVAPAPAATGDALPGADSFGTAALKAAERRRRMALGCAIAAGIVALLTGLIALVKFVASERTYSEVGRAAARQAVPVAGPAAAPPLSVPPVAAGPAPAAALTSAAVTAPPAQPLTAPADAVPPSVPPAAPSVAATGADAAAAAPVAANASKERGAKVRKTASAKKKRAPRDDTFKRCPPLGKKGAVMCRWHICNGGAGKEAACRPYLERAP